MANLHITDSYSYSKREFGEVLDCYSLNPAYGELFRNRSMFSLKTEWATHNALYGLGTRREQTKDVDLNYPQKLWEKLVYPVAGCLVWPFIK